MRRERQTSSLRALSFSILIKLLQLPVPSQLQNSTEARLPRASFPTASASVQVTEPGPGRGPVKAQ